MGALQNAGLPVASAAVSSSAFTDVAYPGPAIITGKKEQGIQIPLSGMVMAHPANDGKIVNFPSATNGSLVVINANGTTLYTITPANINAAATDIIGYFLDDVEGFIYCLGWNSAGTTIYPAKINYNTGVITNIVASTTLTGLKSGVFSNCYFTRRASYGSGDLTIWMVHVNSAQKVSISTTTGLVTSGPTALTVGGANLAMTAPSGFFVPSDESYYAAFSPVTGSYNGPPGTNPMLFLPRAAVASRISTPSLTIGHMINYNAVAAGLSTMVNGMQWIMPAGNGVLKFISTSALASSQNNNNGVYVSSASFEGWLNRIYNILVG